MDIVNPLVGIKYRRAWGPGGGTHAFGQNWQSSWGWDLLHAEKAMPVRAPFDGVVKSAGDGGEGRFAGAKVGIEGSTHSAYLSHLSSVSVSPGDRVRAGQVIGQTGQANGVWHLHFAMCRGPYASPESAGVDPKPFLDASATYLGMEGGYPAYRGDPVAKPKPAFPDLSTLRVVLATEKEQAKGKSRIFAGRAAVDVLQSIARSPLKPSTQAALAWRGNVWRAGPKRSTVTHEHLRRVAKTLVNNYR